VVRPSRSAAQGSSSGPGGRCRGVSGVEAGVKRAKAMELAGEGLSQGRIARDLGVPAANASRWLEKAPEAASPSS
jgi:hypothetical protein